MSTLVVSSKGRIVLPAALRRRPDAMNVPVPVRELAGEPRGGRVSEIEFDQEAMKK